MIPWLARLRKVWQGLWRPKLRLSVIVTTHNRKEILLQALSCLCHQDLPLGHFEIIVIDDGSTDGTREVCEHLALPIPMTYRWCPHKGPAEARNVGLALAKAPLTLFLNDDSLVFSDTLRQHLLAHQHRASEKALVLGHFEQPESSLTRALQAYLEASGEVFAFARMKSGGVYRGEFFYTCNASGPTDVFRDHGGFDTSFHRPIGEDTELGLRLDCAGYRVHYVPDARAIHAHPTDFKSLKKRQVAVAKATVKLFQRYPDLLARWGLTEKISRQSCLRFLEMQRPQQERLEQQIARISNFDTRTEQGEKALDTLATIVPLANRYWWIQGYLHGMEALNLNQLSELLPQFPPPPARLSRRQPSGPECSVIIPTHSRPENLQRLMGSLAVQDLPFDRFEVIVVDDGSPAHRKPVESMFVWPFRTRLLRQAHTGAAAARNLGVSVAQGATLVFFNDDSLPASDALRRHLHRHQTLDTPSLVMGRFELDPSLSQEPLQKQIHEGGFLFAHGSLVTGCRYPGLQFCTANASMPRSIFEKVGGFDSCIPKAGGEDSELGYRLEKLLGVSVLYDGDISAWHTSRPSIAEYVQRQTQLGWVLGYLVNKHSDTVPLTARFGTRINEELVDSLQRRISLQGTDFETLVQWVGHCRQFSDSADLQSIDNLGAFLYQLGLHAFSVGILQGREIQVRKAHVA